MGILATKGEVELWYDFLYNTLVALITKQVKTMDDMEKKIAEENQQSKDSSSNYEFVTETIKKRPVNKKKILKKVLTTVALAVIFGIVASVTLIILYPRLQEKYYPVDETQPVTLPVTQEAASEPVEEFIPPEEDVDAVDNSTENAEILTGEEIPLEIPEEENISTVPDEEEKNEESSEGKNVVINQIVETVEKNLELEDYKALLRKESAVAAAVQKSLVTVSGRSSDTDWFNNTYESKNSATGLIVANNGKELLILCPTDILKKAVSVEVTFCDGNKSIATIRKADINTNLFVVSVLLSSISDETMDQIELAQFGSLAASDAGIPVVAVGSPYGTQGSVGFGQITSNTTLIDKVDANVHLILTDIYGSPKAGGALVNLNGRIVGIICHESVYSDMNNIIHAYAISDISERIEKMSNGQSMSMLGIYGTDVTKEAYEEYKVPKGVYVKEVVVDSPAMKIGIRNGDVIQKIDDITIESFDDYQALMLDLNEGEVVNISIMRPIGESYTEIKYDVTLEALQ